MDVSKTVRYLLNLVGVRPDRKKQFRTVLILIMAAVLFVPLIQQLIYRWNDFDIRIMALKDLNALITSTSFPLEQIFSKQNMYHTLRIIESPIEIHGYHKTKERESIYTDYHNNQREICSKTFKAISLIIGLMVVSPSFLTIFQIVTRDDVIIENLLLPMSFYMSPKFASLKLYVFIYLVDIVLFLYVFSYTASTFVVTYACLQRIVYDYQLLRLLIVEIDDTESNEFAQNANNQHDSDLNLGTYMKQIVRHHQFLNKKVKLVNKLLQTSLFILNNALCFQLCTCLYCAIEIDEKVLQMEFLFLILPVAYVTYNFCTNGQNVLDENNNLLTTLYGCDWVNKPVWFRKCVVTMQISMQREKEIKPFGLYVVNLQNYMQVMRATYSYFHMIRKFQRND